MKIAWLTPFSRRSAIGQCSSTIVRKLRAEAEVAVFASDLATREEAWQWESDLRCIPALSRDEVLRQLDEFDIRIYNLGDNLPYHRDIYELALARPGITVLHDLVMHHFFADYYLEHRKDPLRYIQEVGFAHGEDGERFARTVVVGQAGQVWESPQMLRFHMAKSAVHGSEGIVVHSEYARGALAGIAGAPVVHIPFPSPPIANASPSAITRDEFAPGRKLRLLTFGMANANKMIAEVIEAIGTSEYLRGRVVYHVLGQTDHYPQYAEVLDRRIAEQRLHGIVVLLGRRPDEELHEYLRRSDLVINLRNPHFGESSWSLLEAAFLGRPTVVWKHGFYDEFPDDAVAKVASLEELATTLERLCRDDDARVALGERVRAYARRTFSTAAYCRRLLELAERTRYNRPVLQLVDTAASPLQELGQTSASPLTALVADEIAALGADDVTPHAAGGRGGS